MAEASCVRRNWHPASPHAESVTGPATVTAPASPTPKSQSLSCSTPTVTSVSPSQGAVTGGDTVTIAGTGFGEGADVFSGGTGLPVQHRAVERRESGRIGTVDDDAREACDSHARHGTRHSGRFTSGSRRLAQPAARSRLAAPHSPRGAHPAHRAQGYRTHAAHWQSRPSASDTTPKAGHQGISPGTGVAPEQAGN